MIRMLTLLISLIYATHWCNAQTNYIQGKILAMDTKEPIPFAAIVENNDWAYGTVTQEDGSFSFKLQTSEVKELYIQAIGFKDTIVTVPNTSNDILTIFLSSAVYSLPTVQVSNRETLSEKILAGFPNAPVQKLFRTEGTSYYGTNLENLNPGVLVKTKKKHRGATLTKISFCIVEDGVPEVPFMVRILAPQPILKGDRSRRESRLERLLQEPLIFRNGQVGWNHIDIDHLQVQIPQDYFLIIFTPLDSNQKNQEQSLHQLISSKRENSMLLGIYEDRVVKNIYHIMQEPGAIQHHSSVPGTTPAVVLYYIDRSENQK